VYNPRAHDDTHIHTYDIHTYIHTYIHKKEIFVSPIMRLGIVGDERFTVHLPWLDTVGRKASLVTNAGRVDYVCLSAEKLLRDWKGNLAHQHADQLRAVHEAFANIVKARRRSIDMKVSVCAREPEDDMFYIERRHNDPQHTVALMEALVEHLVCCFVACCVLLMFFHRH
jgi:hypothetical protein